MLLLMTQAFLLFAEETNEEASGVDLLFPDLNETIAGVIAFVARSSSLSVVTVPIFQTAVPVVLSVGMAVKADSAGGTALMSARPTNS